MASSASTTSSAAATPDHGFHPLQVARVVAETAEAASFVLEIPAELAGAYRYAAGQFVTFRFTIDGATHLRCYSMSTSPAVDEEFQVTVKRVPGGVVSNWMLDHLDAGDTVEVTRPAGVFCLADGEDELVAFGGGSGITPIFSLVKAALATTDRRVRLLYANRDADSVIFRAALDALEAQHPGRLAVTHRFDVDHGYADAAAIRDFLGAPGDGAGYYLCGPTPFMDVVEAALVEAGVDAGRIHVERFTPATEAPAATVPDGTVVTIELDGRTGETEHRAGTTILQTARQLGMSPPFSCESGSCATCMARLVEGTADMFVNNALTDEEVEEGWVLTCQAVPTSPSVHVLYGFEGA